MSLVQVRKTASGKGLEVSATAAAGGAGSSANADSNKEIGKRLEKAKIHATWNQRGQFWSVSAKHASQVEALFADSSSKSATVVESKVEKSKVTASSVKSGAAAVTSAGADASAGAGAGADAGAGAGVPFSTTADGLETKTTKRSRTTTESKSAEAVPIVPMDVDASDDGEDDESDKTYLAQVKVGATATMHGRVSEYDGCEGFNYAHDYRIIEVSRGGRSMTLCRLTDKEQARPEVYTLRAGRTWQPKGKKTHYLLKRQFAFS